MTLRLHVDSTAELPDDTEVALISDYVGGFMSEAEAEAFEARLGDDQEFFSRVSPLLDLWYTPGLVPTERATAMAMQQESRVKAARRRNFRIAAVATLAAVAAAAAIMMVPRLRPTTATPAVVTKPAAPPEATPVTTPVVEPDPVGSGSDVDSPPVRDTAAALAHPHDDAGGLLR